MKKIVFLIFTALMSFVVVSGQDTIYLGAHWRKTSKENASYYRLRKKVGNLFKFDDYYISGKIQMSAYSRSADSLVKDGPCSYFDENGTLTEQGNYTVNRKTGEWKTFSKEGNLHIAQTYNDSGKLHGPLKTWYPDGKLKRWDQYREGVFKKGKCFTQAGLDTTWFPFYQAPEFKGGEKARVAYLKDYIVYPEGLSERGIEGKVFVSFIVEEDGRIENVALIKGIDKLMDEAVIKAVRDMPKWVPGRIDGQPARVQFNLPVSFKVK